MRADCLELEGGVAGFPGWALIEVTGSHRERFLASQVTSDVAGLPVGESQPSALLDRSGRLQAFFFLRKRGDAIDLLVPDAAAGVAVQRLEAHVVADNVEIGRREVGPMRLALGPAAVAAAAVLGDDDHCPIAGWGTLGIVTWSEADLGLPELPDREVEALRVLGGPPSWGREIRPNQLINETVLLDLAVSFDKGCYLGQETVAKVASRRGAARGPALLEVHGGGIDVATLVDRPFAAGEQANAGTVLSAAVRGGVPWLQVALRRELRIVGRELTCAFDDVSIDATIHAVPLLPPPGRGALADRLTVAASAAFAGDRPDDAVALLRRAVAVCPTSADAHESLGVILGRLGRHREAVEQMQRLLEVDPSSVMAHSNLSLFFNQLGDIEAAERHLALATRASMASPQATADSRRPAAGADEDAAFDRRRRAGLFRQVLEIDPDDALANFGLGGIAVEEERFVDAAGLLERAIACDPDHAAAFLALGAAVEGLGDAARAREVYERGIQVAAKKGDLSTAQKMQERLTALARQAP